MNELRFFRKKSMISLDKIKVYQPSTFLRKINNICVRFLKHIRFFSSKYWYIFIYFLLRNDPIRFMNFGYSKSTSNNITKLHESKKDCVYSNLYQEVVSSVDVHDKKILEVGCGRGGGAAYIANRYQPQLLVAIDIAGNAIRNNKKHYNQKELTFLQRNAESLEINNEKFDVVLNIESSHCYRNINLFFKEVNNILKPKGYFLISDFINRNNNEDYYKLIKDNGFEIIESANITKNVIQAINSENENRIIRVNQLLPRSLHFLGYEFIGTIGSQIYNEFVNGNKIYKRFVLRKFR